MPHHFLLTATMYNWATSDVSFPVQTIKIFLVGEIGNSKVSEWTEFWDIDELLVIGLCNWVQWKYF